MFNKKEEKQEVEKLESKYRKTIYKVTVEKVDIYEDPVVEYTDTRKKDEKGEIIYDYVQTGKVKEVEKNEQRLYEQKFEDGGLDVKELVLWANRVR